MVRRSHETVFRQSVKQEDEDASRRIALSQTPIMRSRGRPELNKFAGLHKMAAADVIKVESEEDEEPPAPSPAPAFAAAPRLIPVSAPVQVHAVPQSIVVNGSNLLQIKGGGVLPPGTLAQVLSALQNQQNCSQTQLLIPISSIPTYNTAMDNNVLLVSAYNRYVLRRAGRLRPGGKDSQLLLTSNIKILSHGAFKDRRERFTASFNLFNMKLLSHGAFKDRRGKRFTASFHLLKMKILRLHLI